MADPTPTADLRLPADVLEAIEEVNAALGRRAAIDAALAKKRAAVPDAAGLDGEAERLAAKAETEHAIAEADAALGEEGQNRAPTLLKQAKAARLKQVEAKQAADQLTRVIEHLEERARRADAEIASAVHALNDAARDFASGEVRAAWREEYLAAAKELTRQAGRAFALGHMLAGNAAMVDLRDLSIPNPDHPDPIVDQIAGSRLPGFVGSIGVLAFDDSVSGDLASAFSPLAQVRKALARHRPYAPPKVPAPAYERRSTNAHTSGSTGHSAADRAFAGVMARAGR